MSVSELVVEKAWQLPILLFAFPFLQVIYLNQFKAIWVGSFIKVTHNWSLFLKQYLLKNMMKTGQNDGHVWCKSKEHGVR